MYSNNLLQWVESHIDDCEYCKDATYQLDDLVVIGNDVYQSLVNNNKNTPPENSPKWFKL